jgi:hypothetical protein
MDIVLNGICKRFVSVQKTLAKSTTYRCYPHCPQLPVDNSNLAICLWITFDGGGEGVVSVGQSCGSIRPSEKVKIGKGAKSPRSRHEKKRCWRREFQVHT